MALPSTVYKATIQLSDLDRGMYETLQATLARHPSETAERLIKAARHADRVGLLACGTGLANWERQQLNKLNRSRNIAVITLDQPFLQQLVDGWSGALSGR